MNKIMIVIVAMGIVMFGFGKDKSVIEVKFYEESRETPFAVSKVATEQLPDTFEIDTTMHIGEESWRVIGAEPSDKSKFRTSGKLNLYLAKTEIAKIDPGELLYSLPTINNDIASVKSADSLEGAAVLREDDWRQFEFLDKRYESLIGQELDSIRNIYENHSEGMGFNNLHLRKRIVSPLGDAALTLSLLEKSFKVSREFEGVAFDSSDTKIVGGFALQVESDWLLWGQVNESGIVTALNLSRTKESSINGIATEIDRFTEKYGLYLVDWPKLFWCGPGKLNFSAYGE